MPTRFHPAFILAWCVGCRCPRSCCSAPGIATNTLLLQIATCSDDNTVRIWRLQHCPEEEKSASSKTNLVGWATQKKTEHRGAGKAPVISCSSAGLLKFGCSPTNALGLSYSSLFFLSFFFLFVLANSSYSQPDTSTCKYFYCHQDELAAVAYSMMKFA